jgi:multidrug efflux pump
MRRSLGTAVFWGMLGVTVFGVFLTPVFFYVLGWLGKGAAPPHGPATLSEGAVSNGVVVVPTGTAHGVTVAPTSATGQSGTRA